MANKYTRLIIDKEGKQANVDVYDVIVAFGISCPAIAHAVKKLLAAGKRGHKGTVQDLEEVIQSVERGISLEQNRQETMSNE